MAAGRSHKGLNSLAANSREAKQQNKGMES
jgi:hypothetical protein